MTTHSMDGRPKVKAHVSKDCNANDNGSKRSSW